MLISMAYTAEQVVSYMEAYKAFESAYSILAGTHHIFQYSYTDKNKTPQHAHDDLQALIRKGLDIPDDVAARIEGFSEKLLEMKEGRYMDGHFEVRFNGFIEIVPLVTASTSD